MARYVDLHVIPRVEDRESCDRMADLLVQGNYSAIGLTIPTGLLRDRIKPTREVFHSHGINTVLRIDLAPTSRVELLRSLRRFRSAYDIVAVKCLNQRVATVACRDRRVDIIFFDTASQGLRFTHSFARLLQGAIEFNLASDIIGWRDGSVFSKMRKAIGIAQEHKVDVVLSSGAREPSLLRSALEISALGTVLGMCQEKSMKGITSLPLAIMSANLSRRSPHYVEEGVRIVATLIPAGR